MSSRTDMRDEEFSSGLRSNTDRFDFHHVSLRSGTDDNKGVKSGHQSAPIPPAMRAHEFMFGSDASSDEQHHWSAVPNRHTPAMPASQIQPFPLYLPAHDIPPSPPLSATATSPAAYKSFSYNDHDYLYRHPRPSPTVSAASASTPNSNASRSTLWWGDLEPWMDEEYAKQVSELMGWDQVVVKVPNPTQEASSGQQTNNPGYCFLTFRTPAHAASVLSQVRDGRTMPNSNKKFNINWASSVPSTPMYSANFAPTAAPQPYPKEYSIFVGDLAPETSNSDLVAVFRNPVLGLRNDREPKFIRPFLSCKSAKIMLDPVTGVSRGYGFVRFTDESDQQRALIEMHGLYCLSRPMRISAATAKFKAPPSGDFPFAPNVGEMEPQSQPVTIAVPLPSAGQTNSVSAPIAGTSSSSPNSSGNAMPASSSGSSVLSASSIPSLSSGSSSSIASSTTPSISGDMLHLPPNVLAQIAQQYANGTSNSVSRSENTPQSQYLHSEGVAANGESKYGPSESWKHQAQARAILGNLIGPNGEQLTSMDPYNTTVFVGGLSPLINEETLRSFFAPFGDIHYVKVPVGKHCGFVQFVRKADAERAIEKMQGFHVAGSRLRLSWGRSQYKAAQAAAQAAQAAVLQSHFPQLPLAGPTMTPEQALQLLQNFGFSNPDPRRDDTSNDSHSRHSGSPFNEEKERAAMLARRDAAAFEGFANKERPQNGSFEYRQNRVTSFSPFSPDPNGLYLPESHKRDSLAYLTLPHPSKSYAPGFGPQSQDGKTAGSGGNKMSPTSTRPPSSQRYGSFLDGSAPSFQMSRAPGRPEQSVSSKNGRGPFEGHDQDTMHDLNGTLASLDLDQSWRSPLESSESNDSVQFKMSMSGSTLSHGSSPPP